MPGPAGAVPGGFVCDVDGPPVGRNARAMKITYYLEVLSSWCHWVDPVWAELKLRYAGRAAPDSRSGAMAM